MSDNTDLAVPSLVVGSYANRLPVELLGYIFDMILGYFWGRRLKKSYIKSRFVLAQVCSWWRLVVFGSPFLWNSLDVSTATPPDWLAYLVQRAHTGPLDLRFDLYRGAPSSVANCLSRVRTLWITAREANVLNIIGSKLCAASFGSLQVLHLQGLARQSDQLLVPMMEIPGGGRHLRSLRLRRIWFGWDIAPTFTSLRVLVIRDVYIQFAPAWSDWEAIADAAPRLQKLCLRNVGCRELPDHPRTLAFHEMTHLDLVFGNDNVSLRRLISTFDAPNISSLLLFARSTLSFQCLTHRPHMLRNLHEMVLRLSIVDSVALHEVFTHTPNLYSLDVLINESLVLDALAITTSPAAGYTSLTELFVCPQLAFLALDDEDPSIVRMFLESRAPVSGRMRQVMFRSGLPEDEEEEEHVDWIDMRMSVGANKAFTSPSWLEVEYGWDDSRVYTIGLDA
ncbi:hypothetical protein B0H19DRAFT_1074707 [Mycena capillaripes]|nr:hypothetical protein B0H19DRAFT_1074707 [Mycena capillaripes]